MRFNIASNDGESLSMFALSELARLHPHIAYTSWQSMVTTTVDRVVAELNFETRPNLMLIDTQGAELRVEQGSVETLRHLDAVFFEISKEALYEGGCTHQEIAGFMKQFDFRMRWMEHNQFRWGDAFYCRPHSS